jgi:2-polyprenyl-6-hydroxyphenyl methylase/3-demethylubiquinone-9 3-methyltransferase
LWGNESHFRRPFGAGITAASFERRRLTTSPHITTPSEFREFFKNNYGPTSNSLVDRPDARAALDHDPERFVTGTEARFVDAATTRWELEYLLYTARKA